MSPATVALFAGVAVLVYRSLAGAVAPTYEPRAVSRTAPPERIPLRVEFHLPEPRSGSPVLR